MVDKEGRLVFLLCRLNDLVCIIAAMYVPPPFSSDPLKKLAQFIALHPHVPVVALGDFNIILDPQLYRLSLPPRVGIRKVGSTVFASILSELALRDI